LAPIAWFPLTKRLLAVVPFMEAHTLGERCSRSNRHGLDHGDRDDLKEKQIRRGAHRSTRALEDAVRLYVKLNNENPKPFVLLKAADEILASIARS